MQEDLLIQRIQTWRHVFKLDPNRHISDSDLQRICESGTDAIVIGGTDGVTYDNTFHLFQKVQSYGIDCVQEIAQLDAVVPGFHGYFIPAVFNTEEMSWFMGKHFTALKTYGDWIPWDDVLLEAYVSCNPEAKVSQLTQANTDLNVRDMIAYAQLADRLYHVPIFYVEYSGVFGDVEKVKAVSQTLHTARLFYGGGIQTQQQVHQMARWADTIIVGNLIYEDIEQALRTVGWTQEIDKGSFKEME